MRVLAPLAGLLVFAVFLAALVYAFDHPSTWPESYPRHWPAAFAAERTTDR
jgi:hypothetical protein